MNIYSVIGGVCMVLIPQESLRGAIERCKEHGCLDQTALSIARDLAASIRPGRVALLETYMCPEAGIRGRQR